MEKTTKVVLSEKWWKDNKAKTLPEKGLGKALGKLEAITKLAAVAKGAEKAKSLKAVLAVCDEVDKAAAATIKACKKKLHDETKFVLENAFKSAMAKVRKDYMSEYAALEKKIKALTMTDILKDRTYRVLFQQYSKKRYVEENINFLMAAAKKDDKVYKEFIKEGAPQQINIDGPVRTAFDEAFAKGDVKKGPWPKAIAAIINLITINDLNSRKFANFVLGK